MIIGAGRTWPAPGEEVSSRGWMEKGVSALYFEQAKGAV